MQRIMIKSIRLMAFLLMSLTIAACSGEDYSTLDNSSKEEELLHFMESYKESWEESLDNQHYSIMENYFVPNSQVYHMERRLHQDLISEQTSESLIKFENIQIEATSDDVYRFQADEKIAVNRPDEQMETVESRKYTIEQRAEDLRITSIEREDELQ